MDLRKMKDIFVVPDDCKSQFEKENISLSLGRLKILSISFMLLSFYFIYADLNMYTNVSNMEFRAVLRFFHISGLVFSASYLPLYSKIKFSNSKFVKLISQTYILIFLISGSLISINSQRLDGNIDVYIIITVVTSITFTCSPVFMLSALTGNHLLLMAGMYFMRGNYSILVSKQLNATIVFVLSIMMFIYLYRHRAIEFTNTCKLSKSEADFKKLFSVSPIPLILSKFEDGQILFANQRACEFYGYDNDEFHGMSFTRLYTDIKDRYDMLSKLVQKDRLQHYVIQQKLKNDESKWVIANYEMIKYNENDCILTSVTDITEIKKLESELSNHASIDTLTGVLNRRKGIEILSRQIEISRGSNSSLVICFVDVDGLKHVNDTFGHSEGDFLLAKMSFIIKKNIRSTDTLFRYGGDEFVILFPDKDTHFVETVWKRINLELEALNDKKIKPYSFSASHGSYEYNGELNISIDEILDMADKNMYKEKMRKKGLLIGK